MNQGLSPGGRKLRGFAVGDPSSPTSTSTDAHSPTSTEVRSPTRTRTATEVRSPTSTSTEVRSPTNTSTEAYTADNFTATVTGGAGAGATTGSAPANMPEIQGRLLTSNYSGWCKRCKKPYAKGAMIWWKRDKGCHHEACGSWAPDPPATEAVAESVTKSASS